MDANPSTDDLLAVRIAALLDQALAKLWRDDTGARVYSIEDSAQRLNMSPRTLEQWCRDDLIDHTKLGRNRGLTGKQIDRLAAANERKAAAGAVVDPLEVARLSSLKSSSRSRRSAA